MASAVSPVNELASTDCGVTAAPSTRTLVFEFPEFEDVAATEAFTPEAVLPLAVGFASFDDEDDDEQAANVKVAATPRTAKNLFLILCSR